MSEGKRPGGLTALAVINFVFGGFGALGTLALAAVMTIVNRAVESGEESGNEGAQAMADAWQEVGMGVFYFMMLSMAVGAALLIASGVGYLQQKKFLGRTLGTAYAVLAIATAVVNGAIVSTDAGGGFSLITIIGLVYPVLTLLLLNTTFKHDFTR